MGYWGWRPLVLTGIGAITFSVWVTGCNLTSDAGSPASATPYPPVTLTVGRSSTRGSPGAATVSTAGTITTVQSPTPSPTSSPLPTPTPVIYTVQPGDTLLDIALAYEISLEALRAANADRDLTLLQVGQAIVIPPPAPAGVSNPAAALPSPTPAPLLVQPPVCAATSAGTTVCLGQVSNPLSEAIANVAVQVRLLGAPEAASTVAIEQAIIPPDGIAPYRALFDVAWGQFMGATVELVSADPAVASEQRAFPFITEQIAVDGARVRVQGRVSNPGAATALLERAVFTLLNAQGEVLGYRVLLLDGAQLAPDATLQLSADVFALDAPATRPTVVVYVEGRGSEA
jgi:LysM repeat protein